ncbi:MAG TPA: hypothetical protein VGE46_03515 [Bdellovibrio sp.]
MNITTKSTGPESVLVTFTGTINEQTVFPSLPEQKITVLTLNMKDVQSINSMGILHWIRWYKVLEKAHPGIKFKAEELRIQLMSCASVVAGFLPTNTEIMSFYLPYHNEVEALDTQELYVKGQQFNDESLRLQMTVKKTINEQEYEFDLDCMPDRDLRILKLRTERY